MTTQAPFSLRGRNPDILSCIASLSNDEVFTPPEFANRMLDTVAEAWAADNDGANIWANSSVTFLDPCTKSGVFLREITSRLTEGLATEMPDLQTRVNHILTKQVFGIGITRLTSLMARRSVYCSKHAQGSHSIANTFATDDGNIWYERMEHTWVKGRCKYCGAGTSTLDRGDDRENYAYAFIHTDNIKSRIAEMFGDNMQFDVIIGNPPYQMNTDGYGTQARPIYHKFIQQAKRLEPHLMTMVVPARWFSGGMGLDDFRHEMLSDDKLRVIEDFPDSNDVFPGTQIKGGVCYFLWMKDKAGQARVTTHDRGQAGVPAERPLLEPGADVFIRYNQALPIIRKVFAVELGQASDVVSLSLPDEKQFSRLVSSIGAFGLESSFRGNTEQGPGDLKVYRNGGIGWISREQIIKELHVIDKWKVFIPRAGSGSDSFPHTILGKPFLGEPGSISSWTYMHIGPFDTRSEAENVISYVKTRLFRLLVLLHKPSQDATRGVYTFVPTQDFTEPWSDETLYKRYGISEEEVLFINKMIRPMGDDDE
jgi:hypothetical protein